MKRLILPFLALTLAGAETSFEAKWKKALRRDMDGTLSIHAGGIAFSPAKEGKEALQWSFEDVQHFDRVSATEISIQSYVDSAVQLGRDRWYRFALVGNTFSDELHASIVKRIGKPTTDRVAREPADAELAILAKNVRRIRGSQGTLYFTPERIVYASEARRASRVWHLDRDVESIWSSDPYRLEIHVFSRSEAFARRTDVYRFSLKQPLDTSYYNGLKMKVYSLRGPR